MQLVLVQPDNSELITRVEGQTRDLGVTLQVAPGGWTRGTEEQAAAIARERSADFVARVKRSAKGVLEVRIYAAGTGTLRARRVPHAKSERLGTSAELEAAALVLRGELTALIEAEREAAAARETPVTDGGSSGSGSPPAAAGETSGTGAGTTASSSSQRQVQEAKTPKPAPRPKPDEEDSDRASDEASEEPAEEEEEPDEEEPAEEEDEDEPSAPLENYTARRSAWTLRGGARGSIPIEHHVAGGLVLGARAPVSFLEIGLALATALPFEISDPFARITLWRSSLSAEALAVIPVGPRLRALLGIDAGVVLYARSTDRVDPKFLPAASQPSWAATLGAQAELQWLLTRQFGVALGLGLAYLPQRTRFAYTDTPSQTHEIAGLSSLEPQATVSMFGLVGD